MAATQSSYGDDDGSTLSDINVVPLVDVVLVLLIVFMLTVPAVVGSSPIDVNLPETVNTAMSLSADLPLHLTLRREKSGQLALYKDDQPTSEGELRTLLRGFGAGKKPQTILAADKTIPYGEVIKVIDMLGSLGLREFSLNTKHVPR
jgi:biopolymer transport protein ExbD